MRDGATFRTTQLDQLSHVAHTLLAIVIRCLSESIIPSPHSPARSRSPLNFTEGLFQLTLEVADVKSDGAGAVQGRDADHNEIQALPRQWLVRMVIKKMIDALFKHEKVAQTDH